MNLLRADDKVNKNNSEVRDEAIEVISIKKYSVRIRFK